MNVQTIDATNWESILNIQAEAYQEIILEDLQVLKSKFTASPDTCFVALSEQGAILGYLLAHPWSGMEPPKLFEALPQLTSGEYLYLHDMAVSSQAAGQGVGRAMFEALVAAVQRTGMQTIRLVAVQGSETFWARMGFTEIAGASIDSSYGGNAVLMEKQLTT